MDSKQYGEAPLWRVLSELASSETGSAVLSDLARRLLAKSGYPGAYEAIGRAVAAGYAEYDLPATAALTPSRAAVRLTPAGRARVAGGQDYAEAVVTAWRRAAERLPRSPRWRRWHQLR